MFNDMKAYNLRALFKKELILREFKFNVMKNNI